MGGAKTSLSNNLAQPVYSVLAGHVSHLSGTASGCLQAYIPQLDDAPILPHSQHS